MLGHSAIEKKDLSVRLRDLHLASFAFYMIRVLTLQINKYFYKFKNIELISDYTQYLIKSRFSQLKVYLYYLKYQWEHRWGKAIYLNESFS